MEWRCPACESDKEPLLVSISTWRLYTREHEVGEDQDEYLMDMEEKWNILSEPDEFVECVDCGKKFTHSSDFAKGEVVIYL